MPVVVQQSEMVLLMLGAGVLMFVALNRSRLRSLPFHALLLSAFVALFVGWILTVAESPFQTEPSAAVGEVMNALEHLCYAVSSFLLAVWAWHVFVRGRGEAT